MKSVVVFAFAPFLAGAVLLLASCGTAPSAVTMPPPTSATVSQGMTTKAPATTSSASPKYGGVVNLASSGDIIYFDEVYGFGAGVRTTPFTNEELLTGDWTKGYAGGYGSAQTDWSSRAFDILAQKTSSLATSWEIPEAGTIIYHLHQGIHWALNSSSQAATLVNGAEITADDVAYQLNLYASDTHAYICSQFPQMSKSAQITAPDKYTVVVKVDPSTFIDAFQMFGDFANIFPKAVYQKYGNGAFVDWRNSVGTGPFILKDFVSSNEATLVRNPSYWGTDPIGPGKGNKLPYLDGVNVLIITDPSTLQAALRTGKIDMYGPFDWETGPLLVKQQPQLQSIKFVPDAGAQPWNIAMRVDKAPFSDLRVRQALSMAIDWKGLVNSYYGGTAYVPAWPITPMPGYDAGYLSLDAPDSPQAVKDMFTYNPDRAKQLLAQAGFPNGLQASIIYTSTDTTQSDYFSIIKGMWAKVGVDLTLDPKDAAVVGGLQGARNYPSMIVQVATPDGALYRANDFRGTGRTNTSVVSDPTVDQAWAQMQQYGITDQPKALAIHRELMKYVLTQGWVVGAPLAPNYHVWWPWLKNYHGEFSVGKDNNYNFTKWIWLDQDLKTQLLGR